jgi:hypothetical protein
MHVLGVDVALFLPLGSRKFLRHDIVEVRRAGAPILESKTAQIKTVAGMICCSGRGNAFIRNDWKVNETSREA